MKPLGKPSAFRCDLDEQVGQFAIGGLDAGGLYAVGCLDHIWPIL
jgi:hypothetical protein